MSLAKEKDELAREDGFDLKQHQSTEDDAPVGRTNLRTCIIVESDASPANGKCCRPP